MPSIDLSSLSAAIGEEKDTIEDVYEPFLIQNGFLNEERFTGAFIRSKFRQKGWGRLRIRSALRQRAISEILIRRCLKEIEGPQYAKALDALAQKRWDQLLGEQNLERKKQKLANYLQYRGWETELVFEKVRELSEGG